MKFNATAESISVMKKGMKITFACSDEHRSEVMQCLHRFKSKPLTITVGTLAFPAEMDTTRVAKNGFKIVFGIHDDDVERVLKNIDQYTDMELLVDVTIDAAEQLQRMQVITPDQRNKIYALFADIGNEIGMEKESTKETMKAHFCQAHNYEDFSLSNCPKEQAGEFIEFMVQFCFEQGLPIKEHPRRYLTDVYKFAEMCLRTKHCTVCLKPKSEWMDLEEAHIKAIGMGRNRRKVDNPKLRRIALCAEHHREQHNTGIITFLIKYKLEELVFGDESM